MRIARYTTGEDPAYGVVEGEPGHEVVLALQGDPLYIGVVPGDGEIEYCRTRTVRSDVAILATTAKAILHLRPSR